MTVIIISALNIVLIRNDDIIVPAGHGERGVVKCGGARSSALEIDSIQKRAWVVCEHEHVA